MTKRKSTPLHVSRARGAMEAAGANEAVTRYIESSALVAALLEGDTKARASIRGKGRIVTSMITIAEATRAILRARLSDRIAVSQQRGALVALQKFARRCHIVSVTEEILSQAGRPFPVEPVRTLDAIHLATAAALEESPALLTMVTRDARVRENAKALGHPVE